MSMSLRKHILHITRSRAYYELRPIELSLRTAEDSHSSVTIGENVWTLFSFLSEYIELGLSGSYRREYSTEPMSGHSSVFVGRHLQMSPRTSPKRDLEYIGRRGLSLSGSYQQGYSTTYNTQSHIKVVCNGYILTHILN